MHIEMLNHEDPDTRARLVEYLAPNESYALFLLGNLTANHPGSHLYAAVKEGRWRGVAGYYDSYKSVSLFAEDTESSRALIRSASLIHPDICYLSGGRLSAEPACDELQSLGYRLKNSDPQLIFMELEGALPYQKGEELCRPFCEEDTGRVARLLRYLSDRPLDAPITEIDLENIRTTYLRHVLVFNEEIVSVASTNGMGVRTFQILGVATEESLRGRGFAAAVCASLIRDMARRGATRCVLFTTPDNAAAQHCYLRMGFHVTGNYYLARLENGTVTGVPKQTGEGTNNPVDS
jgi:ribosomal protein S18 acetylase RimI-like enzyme